MALRAPYIILADPQHSKDGDPLALGAARAETEIISNSSQTVTRNLYTAKIPIGGRWGKEKANTGKGLFGAQHIPVAIMLR